jgi:hypothetical protein
MIVEYLVCDYPARIFLLNSGEILLLINYANLTLKAKAAFKNAVHYVGYERQ